MKPLLKAAYNGAIRALPARASLSAQFLRSHGRLPDLRAPKTFNEKVQALKLTDPEPLAVVLADKVKAKDWVASELGQEWVIPTLWSGTGFPTQDERTWSGPFVMKANHASGWNAFVRGEPDWSELEDLAAGWLSTPFLPHLRERWYNMFERQILFEPLIGDVERAPYDYKFFVFNGRAEYVQVDTDRATEHKRCFYDRQWKRQPFGLKYPLETRDLPKPINFGRMLAAAETIASSFPFARVDFYDLPSGPKFGEATFAPGSGYEPFSPPEWDRTFGDLWR